MENSIKLKFIAIITYLLFIPMVIYLKYFPSIISPFFDNIIIIIIIFTEVSLIAYGCFIIKKQNDIFFILPQSILLTFIVRIVPNLCLQYPPYRDPYYYAISTINIIDSSSLQPLYSNWYWGIDRMLHWPMLQLFSAMVINVSNINILWIMKYQEPFIGAIFFIVVYIMAYAITKDSKVSLLTGLLSSLSDIIIYYQTEYHSQGFSLLFFVLFIYITIKCINNKKFLLLVMIIGFAFTLSHYFTPLFISIIFITTIIMYLIIKMLSKNTKTMDTNIIISIFFIFIIFNIAYNVVYYDNILNTYFSKMITDPLIKAPLVSISVNSGDMLSSILPGFKWLLFILSTVSIIYAFINKNDLEHIPLILYISILFSGIIGNYLIASPLDRIISFYTIFAALFSSLTIFRIKDRWLNFIKPFYKSIFCLILISTIITAAILNSSMLAFFFKNDSVFTTTAFAYPTNDYKLVGDFISNVMPNNVYIYSNNYVYNIPFFYAKISENNLEQEPNEDIPTATAINSIGATDIGKYSLNKYLITYTGSDEYTNGSCDKYNKIFISSDVIIYN